MSNEIALAVTLEDRKLADTIYAAMKDEGWFPSSKVAEMVARHRIAAQPAATSQEVGREAFKAGWRTNAVGEETHPASYLDNCEQGDWEEYQRRGINAYLAALTAEPAAKAGDAGEQGEVLA